MRDNSFAKSQCKVNFSYVNSPMNQQACEVVKERFPTNVQSNLEMGSKKNVNHIEAKPLPVNYASQNHTKQQNTLKKQGWGIEATTLRKSFNTKKPEKYLEEGEMISLDGFSHEGTIQTNEACLLKEQIRYMRRRLIEVQNAEKELRLQFQMYKACNEQPTQKISLGISEQTKQQKICNEQKREEENKKNENQELLKEQIRQLQTQFQKAVQLNKSMMQKMMDQNEQAQRKLKQIQLLKQQILDNDECLNKSEQQNVKLKALVQKCQKQTSDVHLSMEQKLKQHQNINELLQAQKRACIQISQELKKAVLTSNQLRSEITVLKNQIMLKNKDIEFLNGQSMTLDQSLNNAFEELKYLHTLLAQSKQDQQSSLQIAIAREQKGCLQQKVMLLENQVQKMAIVIYELRTKYQNTLYQLKEDSQMVQKLKQSTTQISKKIQTPQINSKNSSDNQSTNIAKLEGQIIKLNEQNKQMKFAAKKMQESQKILLNELEWIKQQRDTNKLAQQNQVQLLKNQITLLNAKYQQQTLKFQDRVKKIGENFQLRQEEVKIRQTSSSQTKKNAGESLSKQQLQRHILLLKNQPSHNDEQLSKLREQLQATRQQMQYIKLTYTQEIQHMKARYQKQIKVNNEQYVHQLNVYTETIDSLMAQMDQIKKNSKYYNSVIQQQEEENDIDQVNVKRDIIKYGEDQSDFYVSPPSNAHSKPFQAGLENDGAQQRNYVLKDLLDLDTKINNYIQNFNKKPTRS